MAVVDSAAAAAAAGRQARTEPVATEVMQVLLQEREQALVVLGEPVVPVVVMGAPMRRTTASPGVPPVAAEAVRSPTPTSLPGPAEQEEEEE